MLMKRFPLVLVAATLLFGGCTRPAEDAAKAGADAKAPATTTVVTVNGKQIGSDVMDIFVQAVTGKPAAEATEEQKTQLLDQLVNMSLAAQAAEKDGLQKDPEVKAKLELIHMQILAEAATQKYVKSHPVSETELKAVYDTQVANMPKEYKARHILVEKKETAESIIRELQAGGDFAKLAASESKDASGKNGGDLGWFSLQTMVKPFADAVAALEKGKTTEQPVQTEFGWHVIQLEDVRSGEAPKFEDVKPQVEMFAQRKKLQAYLDELRKTAQVQKPK
ncbi:MAG: peptidyl-prolyl cis-trans isomerase [Proteobacteria bacterium]|nr:peptidyl-prolyl cis-trans isomerase [Pseudomonadota bacterium]